jgi:hypothetical protein
MAHGHVLGFIHEEVVWQIVPRDIVLRGCTLTGWATDEGEAEAGGRR